MQNQRGRQRVEHSYIPRTLWHEKTEDGQTKKVELSEADLLAQTRPLIVLGEAGMGKTLLLKKMSLQPGYAYCTAQQLIARHRPERCFPSDAHTLVIDALDESPAHQQHDAVTQVLSKLDALNYPRFVLSCRAAEWHSATAIHTIQSGDYTDAPLQLHLAPFSAAETQAFLGKKLGSARAAEVLEHFENLGLTDWLGNPQTLVLISALGQDPLLPQTRAQLFQEATNKLAVEHNSAKSAQQHSPKTLINAAGAACAALIVCAQTSIVRKPSAHLEAGEILLQTLQMLPDGALIEPALNTRLFSAHSAEKFGYMHRHIGEYLAAQWLAQQANTPRKRRRLLAMFQHHGLVPASLRGLYAWLALDPKLTEEIIAFDPLAVLEYGDTAKFSAAQTRLLFQALTQLTENNPRQWQLRSIKARCFAQTDLRADVTQWIANQKPSAAWLRVLVIESLEATAIASELRQELQQIITNADDIYIARSAAFLSITKLLSVEESNALLATLAALKDEDSLRLALDVAHTQGFENFQAAVLANICLGYAMTNSRMAGKFFYLQKYLPNSHLLHFLDVFTAGLAQHAQAHKDFDALYDTHELAFSLMARAVEAQLPDAKQMLQWLSVLDDYHTGSTEKNQLNIAVANAPQLRQAIQHTLLITQSTKETLRENCITLSYYLPTLQLTEPDLIGLLDALPAYDERWQELVLLTHHDEEHGAAIRHKAQKFIANSPTLQSWLEQLARPRIKHEWEIKDEENRTKRQAKKSAQKEQNIAWHTKHIDALKAGDWEACWWAASIYMRGNNDEVTKKAPPEQRLQHVLTEALAHAAHSGFEAHLLQPVSNPTLDEIAQSYAKSTEYRVSCIVLAGMLERLRKGGDLASLSNERILSGFLFLQSGLFHAHSGANTDALNTCVLKELIRREVLEKAVRLFYEPQLQANVQHVSSLHQLLHDEAFSPLSVALAQEWLQHFPDLHSDTENHLIDCLIRHQTTDVLRALAQQRPNPHPVAEQHLTWEAVRLLTDFESQAQRLENQAIDKNLLWELQTRSQRTRYVSHGTPLVWSSAQCTWVFANFRTLWPATGHPLGVSGGSHNPWDATEFLHAIAQQLANDTTPEAVTALHALRNAPTDGYTEFLQSLCAQQQRKRCEQAYVPASLDAFASIAIDEPPQSIQDLQAWVLQELHIVQAKIRSNDVNSGRGFYADDNTPYDEERCRDHLLELLRQGSDEVNYTPETHVADDKEVDITCAVGALRLPIEIKGQWHKNVWTAADAQLDRLYTPDWQAEGHGIYLVLWFGKQKTSKALKTLGKGHPTPTTAEEMQQMLTAQSNAAQSGRVAVVVLDVVRQQALLQTPATQGKKLRSAHKA